jgi:hypothetical protein
MLKISIAVLLTGAACAACSVSEPREANAGTWSSPPNPGGSVTVFSLDSSGSALDGSGTRTSLQGRDPQPLFVQGVRTADGIAVTFYFDRSGRATYVAAFDGPDRLIGQYRENDGPIADSVLFIRK